MTPKRCALLLVPAAVLIGVAAGLWPFEPHITDADRAAMCALVSQQTSEPILGVRPIRFWRAVVRTGVVNGPLDGHGSSFVLRWSWAGWRIEEEYVWVS